MGPPPPQPPYFQWLSENCSTCDSNVSTLHITPTYQVRWKSQLQVCGLIRDEQLFLIVGAVAVVNAVVGGAVHISELEVPEPCDGHQEIPR